MGIGFGMPLLWSTFHALIASGGSSGWKGDLLTFGFFAIYALPFALFAGLDAYIQRRWMLPRTGTAALQAGLMASVICLCWTPVPYSPVVAIVEHTAMLQLAAWGGESLLLALLIWPSAILATLLTRGPQPRYRALLVPAISLVAVYAYGDWRIDDMAEDQERGRGQQVAALPLQLDLPSRATGQLLTRDRPNAKRSALELTRSQLQGSPHCDLVVWPEVPLDLQQSDAACGQRQQIATALGIPLLMQCHRVGSDQIQVSAEWTEPNPQPVEVWHGKSSLVPVYERPLFGKGLIARGEPGTVFELDPDRRLIPTLCYELHSPAHLRAGVLAGGNFIVHMASFTAFARQPVDVVDQATARLRAVEFGVPIIRSANRGPVGWIDANGRVRKTSARFGNHAACEQVWSPATTPTAYTYLSPIAAWLPGAVMLLLGWLRRRSRAEG